MNKKCFVIILILCALVSLNFCAAHEIDNSTEIIAQQDNSTGFLEKSSNAEILSASDKPNTHIDAVSNTTFDVVGEYFKVKLSDGNNKSISNVKVVFTVNGVSYAKNTDSKGIASLQIRLADGSYKITSKFAGNSMYKASSYTTKITMNNTRVVESGLTNAEIQNIIDNAKVNNIILFKGASYSDINLVITKSLTLLSNVNTVLKSTSNSPVITIKGKNASLTSVKGFNIQGNGDGVKVDGSDYVTIIKNDITTRGSGIAASNVKYLNITKNNIVKNGKCGIILSSANNSYIVNNKITNNGENGIVLTKSSMIYIHENTVSNNVRNGILLTNKYNGFSHKTGPQNVFITKNTVNKNKWDGISVDFAGDNINIRGNTIDSNVDNGISLNKIGHNNIQSNVITNNYVGIKFAEEYAKPKNQKIEYNAIYGSSHVEIEAKETYATENGEKLTVGDNWYTDNGLLCPKISTNNLKFTVTQIGKNQFQASFVDSKGNIATLLPDRILTYKTNDGKTFSVTISGGIGTFTVDAKDADIIKATVDRSSRKNVFDSKTPSSAPINGQSPTYNLPSIPQYGLFEDIGNGGGSGDGNGQGSNGNANRGNESSHQSSDNTGNSSHSQKMEPNDSPTNQANDVSQSYDSLDVAQASASESSGANADSGSTAKQIIIDDEIFKVKGTFLIILLIILTIGLYYRDDIKDII